MKLNITGRHTEVTKALKQYVRKRFTKWDALLAPDTEVHVILAVEGYRHQVEVTVHSGRQHITARQVTKDMYSAIDLLAEKVERQLVRQHDKRMVRGGAATTRRAAVELTEPEEREPPRTGRIVEIVSAAGKPMTREEAALQFAGGKQPFWVFEDIESGQLAVLVRRKDGQFTLVVKD